VDGTFCPTGVAQRWRGTDQRWPATPLSVSQPSALPR